MRRSITAVCLILGLLGAPFLPAAAQEQDVAQEPEAPDVPQTFDWWRERGVAATTDWGQAIDVASTEQILSWTTMPEYTTPLVDHLPEGGAVVSPTRHFGHPIGRPGVLHTVAEIYGYLEALAGSSERVRFDYLGETEEGNRLALVQVGSEQNLARLDAVKEGLNALADPRGTSADEARQLIASLPVVYTFYAGLHSTETGPPEMVMELAYRLAASDDPVIQQIRDNVVVFIVPVAEPDGRNRVVEWHRRFNEKAYDGDDEVPGPPYWGKYIFHDNNRDGLQLSARLTQELVNLFLDWKYPVGHDLHESIPYLYVSTGTGPYNPTVDPITVSEWQWLSNFEVTALTAHGLPGVWTHGFYDGWYPGYLLWVTNTRNAVGRFYETFGNGAPTTQRRTLGDNATAVEWYRPNPPRDTTIWSLRNNTNYMQSGALSALSVVAQYRQRILEQYWTKSNNSLEQGRTSAPFAYVVPATQERSEDAEYMLNLLQRQGIELHRATADASFDDVEIERGDYVVRMDQPYRNFVLTLMQRQEFPEDAPRPYDDVAWTFPLMFNIEAQPVDDAGVQALAMEPVATPVSLPGRVETRRGADWYVIVPNASAHSIDVYLALRGTGLEAAEDTLRLGDRTIRPGAWLVPVSASARDEVQQVAREHGVTVVEARDEDVRAVARHALDAPRIALLHSWRNTQDEGWVRYALDQADVPYTYIGEDEIAGQDLRASYDVIVFPNQGSGSSSKAIFQGVDPKWSPLPYTRTAEYGTHGTPDASEDITGGMGFRGLAALQEFVERGGTFITLGSASTLPIDFGMVRDVSLKQTSGLFVPGSIVKGEVRRATNPITYGYASEMPLYHRFGPYFNVAEDFRDNVVVRYAQRDSLLMSGLVANPQQLAGDPAIVVAPLGEGYIVLFGFDPLHRYQSHGNFAFVWNALMNWNDLGIGLEAEERAERVADQPPN
ncbi:MAG: M14 family zinc carboxypeptidase [Longimicrobiales bacterium]